jgi:hypothetical protein
MFTHKNTRPRDLHVHLATSVINPLIHNIASVIHIVTMAIAIVRATYTDQDALERFFANIFGRGGATVLVRHSSTIA